MATRRAVTSQCHVPLTELGGGGGGGTTGTLLTRLLTLSSNGTESDRAEVREAAGGTPAGGSPVTTTGDGGAAATGTAQTPNNNQPRNHHQRRIAHKCGTFIEVGPRALFTTASTVALVECVVYFLSRNFTNVAAYYCHNASLHHFNPYGQFELWPYDERTPQQDAGAGDLLAQVDRDDDVVVINFTHDGCVCGDRNVTPTDVSSLARTANVVGWATLALGLLFTIQVVFYQFRPVSYTHLTLPTIYSV